MASYSSTKPVWWTQDQWSNVSILCEKNRASHGVWSKGNYPLEYPSSVLLLQFALILLTTTIIGFLLKPLRIPFFAQVTAGLIIGLVFPKHEFQYYSLLPPIVLHIVKTYSFIGFALHSFILGVQTNISAFKSIGKKSTIVGFSGLLTSLAFSWLSLQVVTFKNSVKPQGLVRLITLNAQTFYMVTCSHLNDLGISNSDIGRLAAPASLILDAFGIVASFLILNLTLPILEGGKALLQPAFVIAHILLIAFVFRPLVLHIVNKTQDGKSMSQSNFVILIIIVIIISIFGELVDYRYSAFLFALTLPEEPLSTILAEKLDFFTSGFLFPLYCAIRGFETNIYSLTQRSGREEFILLSGCAGKFFGILISSITFGFPFWSAFSLSIIMSSKGLFDIVTLGFWRDSGLVDIEEYTLVIIHILSYTGAFLPIVRYIYEPSRQYSAILRQTLMASCEDGTLQTLACIYKEENLPGILRLLEAFHPTRAKPLPVISLQLMQLTGRCSLPILAPFHQVKSTAAFRSNLPRCNRIVNAFSYLERVSKGYTRLQHYISVSPYATMHNDICNLAYDKNISLLILPFHTQCANNGIAEEYSQSIREVNKMVLEKAPCSVGILIDRSEESLRISDSNVYRIAIFFIGGVDDHEALAYSRLFASHPNVRLIVIWFKSTPSNDQTNKDMQDYEAIEEFLAKSRDNERISFKEVIVNDADETTQVMISMKDIVDLVVVGRHHDSMYTPILGLNDGWSEYSELGIVGDMLATTDFKFSLLVVQQEPQASVDKEFEILMSDQAA